jgi:hypothetical protein
MMKQVVATDAPKVVAGQLADSNSDVSKGFKNNFEVATRR